MNTLLGQNPETTKPGAAMIIDGEQANFMGDVIEASRALPVIVDFWATWVRSVQDIDPGAGEDRAGRGRPGQAGENRRR